MKVPVSWLKEYVDFDDSIQGLADKLTFSGTEVEGIHTIGSGFEGIVVGEVTAVNPHPNADRLTVCTVTDGSNSYEVVCGAPNVQAGGRYPFAPIGTTLPNGMKLKKAKIRGVESQGMLCAEDELAISDDHTGLLELEADAKTGAPLSEILGPPETVLELEVTPNRPDCLSILGIAREVAAMYGTELKRPRIDLPEEGEPVEKLTSVTIEDADRCPRYTARILTGIRIGPSPAWMKQRLTLAGVRPISNVVDITNYVMLECGHPLHAFDQTLLKEGRIVVRRAEDGEKMSTLDEIDRELNSEMLVIADAERPVALAGIMGGAGSEIRDNTETVLLESAYFEPDHIRLASKQLGLSTESSYRFERGTDIGGVEWASRRAAALMVEFAGATVASGIVDEYPKPYEPRKVTCRAGKTATLLGIDVDTETMARIFKGLELPVTETTAEACTVDIPSFRTDLEREVDLIEEYARINGLDRIPSPAPQTRIVPDADDHRTQAVFTCREHLVSLGLREIMNYSLVSQELLDLFNPADKPKRIVMPHPISMDQSILRTSLIPQLVESLGHNRAHQVPEAAFFEIGRVFMLAGDGHSEEEERVSLGIMGPLGRGMFDKRTPVDAQEMFLTMKGIVASLMEAQKIDDWSLKLSGAPYLEEDQSVTIIVEGMAVGIMGVVRSDIRAEWRLHEPIVAAELSLDPLLAHAFDINPIAELAAFPPIERDMALIVDKKIRHQDILDIIKKSAPKELENVTLFDIFESEALGVDKRSMAYSLTYRSLTRTLTDEDANAYHEAVKQALRDALKIDVREG